MYEAKKPEIIARMSAGESLRSICQDEGMPTPPAVIKWTTQDEEFGEHYARAVEARADTYFDQLDAVSDEAVQAETAVQVQGLRLKADNIKWQLARMAPKKYGDRIQTEVTGAGGGPVQTSLSVQFVSANGGNPVS